VVVLDYRDDGGDWWLPRLGIGDEMFNRILESFEREIMVVFTKYPTQSVAEYVMRLMFKDIE